jgi:outer membrane receptor protein involved in Fe transport
VVTGGASAVYGSDALAGVVNFQLIDNFEGVELTGLYDITTEGDAEKWNVDITVGGNFADGRGNATVYASYSKRESLFQGDRDFSRFTLTDVAPAGTPGMDPNTGVGGPFAAGGSSGVPGTHVFGGPPVPSLGGDPLGVFDSNGGALPWIEPDSRFNYAPDNYLQLPQERYLTHAQAHFDINEKVTAYTEMTFSHNLVPTELAPTPAFMGYLEVNPDSVFFSPELQGVFNANADPVTGNYLVPYIGRRMVENGSRQSVETRDNFRILVGARGDFTDNWGWDTYFSHSQMDYSNLLNNDVSETRFRQAALTTTDGTACQDPSGGCAPLNIFGPGNISQDAIDFINIGASNVTSVEFEVMQATINGSFGGIGDAGPIGVALGWEHRDDTSSLRNDAFLASGDVLGFNSGQDTVGKYTVTEYFGEIDIPLLSGVPFAESLSIWGAARASDYSNIGNVTSYATAINWAPIEMLRFRGGFQRAVRAPNVLELFGGIRNGFPGATDPCSVDGSAAGTSAGNAVFDLCAQTGVAPANIGVFTQANVQIEGLFGGNPDLIEEESDTVTFGIVIQPIDSLDITIDYFDIEVENAIFVLGGGVSNVLDICYNQVQDISSAFCQAFDRRTDGNVNEVRVLNENIGGLATSGVDLAVNWVQDFDFGMFGEGSTFAISLRSTFLDTADIKPVSELTDVNKCAGNFGNTICGEPRPDQMYNTRFTWANGPLVVSALWRFIASTDLDRIENEGADPATLANPSTDSQNYVDLSASYQFTDSFRLNFGIKNLLDEEPNFLGDEQNEANTYNGTYDIIGPRTFISASYKFD